MIQKKKITLHKTKEYATDVIPTPPVESWEKELSTLLTKMSEHYLIDDEFEAQLKWFIANALKDYAMEVIGEDEQEYDDLYDMEMRDYKIRNRLRAEQRKKLEE